MKILVTGSSGTIGTYLCEQLIADGFEVVGADLRPNRWNLEVNEITVNLDLRDSRRVSALLPHDFDAVVHLAANARVHNLVVEPALAQDNIVTTFNMLEFARSNSIRRFIFASSREVYGNTESALHSEDEATTKHCESPYTASKVAGEALVHSYQHCYGIDFIIVRFSNVYGRYDESDRVVPKFIRQSASNSQIIIYGNDKILDFTHISDAVSAVEILLRDFDNQKNEVFNVASGKGSSLLEVAELINTSLGSSSKILIQPSRVGEVIQYTADISKIRKRTTFNPKVNIEEGIGQALQWYKEHMV